MNIQQTSLFTYYNEIKPKLGKRQKLIYEALKTRENFTNQEIADHLGLQINTITPRIKELRDAGLVRFACERKCESTGRNVKAWEVGKLLNKLAIN